MGNIVGENFDPYVVNQINVRQNILGSINKDNNQLVWENSKTSWVKLISSTNLIDSNKNFLPNSVINGYVGGSKLAERFVLFNGVSDESSSSKTPTTIQRSGIGINNAWGGTNAYGLGGSDFGLQPMPGILSATIKTETRGTLKTGTVNIKVNNKQQFEIISTLYLRLGYIMLLEWGNNCYYDNNGNFISDNTLSLADGFLAGTYNYSNILNKIQEQRRISCGNYDALVGKVVNYNWTFNRDGSYDVVIIIRSVGDIIESLKVNSLLPKTEETNGETPEGDAAEVIVSYAHKDSLSRHLAKVISGGREEGGANGGTRIFTIEQAEANRNTPFGNPPPYPIAPYFKQQYANGKFQYFVRFGELLSLIEEFFMPDVNIGGVKNPKLTTFDKDVSTNLIATHPKQVPSDPRTCIFAKKVEYYSNVALGLPEGYLYSGLLGETINAQGERISGDFEQSAESFVSTSNPRAGKLMNVYFNMVYVIQRLDDLRDKEGKVVIVDFLNTLMTGFSKTTGNYNNITARIDTDINKIIFIDETVIPGRNSLLKNNTVANFNVYGFETNNSGRIIGGSFIRDLQLKTGITPDLATMVTIGATAAGYVTGQDATMLSNLNKGTQDRIQPQIQSPDIGNRTSEEKNEEIEAVYKNDQEAFDTFINENTPLTVSGGGFSLPQWNEDNFSKFTNTQVQLLEYETKKETKKYQSKFPFASSPTNGFLPFDLNLTIDGLSGIKIYQKYLIDTQFLPTNYPETMEFIVKGISHTIQNNIWITNIESLTVPKPLDEISLSKSISRTRPTSTNLGGFYNTFTDNNPFNIVATSTPWKGKIGQKLNPSSGLSFEVFDTLENGTRAGLKNLESYFKQNLNTVRKIINTYAPPNSPGQTAAATNLYINNVTKWLNDNWKRGITADTVLSFKGSTETNPDNIKMFKELNKAIITVEGKLTPYLKNAIDNFIISNLR